MKQKIKVCHSQLKNKRFQMHTRSSKLKHKVKREAKNERENNGRERKEEQTKRDDKQNKYQTTKTIPAQKKKCNEK